MRIRETAPWLNEERLLAFSTVQAVMEILYRKGWLGQEAGEDAERRDLTVAYLAMRESCKAWGGELAGDWAPVPGLCSAGWG